MAASLALGSATVASAAPPSPMKSLRHLVFSYHVESSQQSQKHGDESFDNPSGGKMAQNPTYYLNGTSDGTLTVDVVAVTGDGGLVVDASEHAGGLSVGPARIAIDFDGNLMYDRLNQYTDEAVSLLSDLSRGLIGVDTPAPGSTWAPSSSAPGSAKGSFVVRSLDKTRATIDYSVTFARAALDATDETETGTMVYDTKLLVPVTVHRHVRATEKHAGANVLVDAVADANLVSDSFASPAPSVSAPAR